MKGYLHMIQERINKLLAVFFAFVLVLFRITPQMIFVSAEEGLPAYDGFYYSVDETGNAVITGAEAGRTDLRIPSVIDGHYVTTIDTAAFGGIDFGIHS